MSETKEEVKLPKHLAAALNQLQKQYEKYGAKIIDLEYKRNNIMDEMSMITRLQSSLSEQIKKLKGE